MPSLITSSSSSSSPLSWLLLLRASNSRNNNNKNSKNTKTNHEVCIADQEISFTACILLHSYHRQHHHHHHHHVLLLNQLLILLDSNKYECRYSLHWNSIVNQYVITANILVYTYCCCRFCYRNTFSFDCIFTLVSTKRGRVTSTRLTILVRSMEKGTTSSVS